MNVLVVAQCNSHAAKVDTRLVVLAAVVDTTGPDPAPHLGQSLVQTDYTQYCALIGPLHVNTHCYWSLRASGQTAQQPAKTTCLSV